MADRSDTPRASLLEALPVGDVPGADDADQQIDDLSNALDAAHFRLMQARRQLADVQAHAMALPLDVDQIAELEAAHTAILDSQERSETRFGGARAKRLLVEARAAEHESLTRLGFETFAQYVMSTWTAGLPDEALVALAARQVAEAQGALDQVMATPAAEPSVSG